MRGIPDIGDWRSGEALGVVEDCRFSLRSAASSPLVDSRSRRNPAFPDSMNRLIHASRLIGDIPLCRQSSALLPSFLKAIKTISTFSSSVYRFCVLIALSSFQSKVSPIYSQPQKIVPNLLKRLNRTILAYPVLILESALFAGLIIPSTRRLTLIGCGGLFGLFAVVTFLVYNLSPESTCGCFFSFGSTKADLLHVAQNMALTGLALFLWRSSPDGTPMANESR